MKKRIVKKSTRQRIIAASLFFLTVSLVGLYWSYTRTPETAESYTAFPYMMDSAVDYQVYLRPNNLYEEPSLGSGRAYISALTDYIDTKLSYRFSGGSVADLKGEYYATATIKALTGQENYLVWEKSFPLLPPETFQVNGTEVVLEENIIVPFAHYVSLTENIVEETGFSPQNLNLEVNYNIALTADTPDGTVVETAAPKLIIPLTGKIFTIEGSLENEATGGIEAIRLVPTPYYKEAKIGFSVLSVVFSLFLLIFVQMTVAAREEDSLAKKKLSRLLKQYRDRIVESAQRVSFPNEDNALVVGSFDDLLKVADELEKPIVYQSQNYGPDFEHLFFVISDECAYRFNFGRVPTLSMDTPTQKHFPSRRYAKEQG